LKAIEGLPRYLRMPSTSVHQVTLMRLSLQGTQTRYSNALHTLKISMDYQTEIEEFIHVAELTIGMAKMPPRSPEDTENEWSLHEGAKVMGAAAVVSGTAGLLALGPFTGIALGAATAYATTREDQAGSAARRVGVLGVQLVHTAKAINREHSIGQRVLSATAQTQQVLYTFNERHRVTDKLNRGLSAAGLALSSFVSKATR